MKEVDIAKAKIDPRGVFANPRDVLGLTGLNTTDRFIILWRWRAQAKKDGDAVHAKHLKRMIFELEQATIGAR